MRTGQSSLLGSGRYATRLAKAAGRPGLSADLCLLERGNPGFERWMSGKEHHPTPRSVDLHRRQRLVAGVDELAVGLQPTECGQHVGLAGKGGAAGVA